MSSDNDINDQVKAELITSHVKLWLPPYYTANHNPNEEALQRLARELSTKLDKSENVILTALLHWQSHALEKKKLNQEKKHNVSVEIKLLGLREEHLLDPEESTQHLFSWAQKVNITTKAIKLEHINPMLTVSQMLDELKTLCHSSQVRLVHKGKSISCNEQARLSEQLLAGGVKSSSVVLCLVSNADSKEGANAESPDHALIASIRNAATKLQSGATFEITDQHGNHVSMLHTERLAFVTALGLHRLGRKRMEDNDGMPSALVFLLEADQEWNQVNPQWRNKVDNYGLLQLDICWVYLKLESLENLPDVTRRLEVAETVLRKQVHANFVTLALVQADMENPVPPLAAVFVRLFLLQGIAYRYSNHTIKSKERLDWAWSLCQSSRTVSSEDAVVSLCEAIVGISKPCAISALRRTNGDLNAAATLIDQDKQDAVKKHWQREEQHRIGHCQNGMDLVNLELVPQLQSILGLPSTPRNQNRAFAAAQQQMMDLNFKVAAGLLRLANNDLEKAISLYQEMQGNQQVIMQRVSALDRRLEEQGVTPKHSRKRSRDVESEESLMMVDQVALATLVSMGVNDGLARKALKKSSNNVEMSLLWLSNQQEATDSTGSSEEANVTETDQGSKQDDEDSIHEDSNDSQHDGSTLEDEYNEEERQAQELLEQELAEVLNERDMEKEYLGNSLDEEWTFINKFRKDSNREE